MEKTARILSTVIFILSILLMLVDVYGSDTRLEKYLHINSRMVALGAVASLIILRVFYTQKLTPFISMINTYFILPLTLSLSIYLSIWGAVTPPNFVFATTHVQYTQVFIIALLSGITTLLQQPDRWFNKYYRKVIFLGAPLLVAIGAVVWTFPFEVFRRLSHEDALIENLQVLALLLGAFWSIRIARRFFTKRNATHGLIFMIITIGLLFVAGDEISWGQRLLHITTPPSIAQNNAQGEITIHNLSSFHSHLNTGFMIAGALGAFAWIVQKLIPLLQRAPAALYIPPWFTSGYYLLVFAFYLYEKFYSKTFVDHWSEFTELMFYIGIALTLLYWFKKPAK